MDIENPNAVYSDNRPVHPNDIPFYAQIGACLMEWAPVDSILFNICGSALGVSDNVATVVYARTPTLESRCALITDLISARFPKHAGDHDHDLVKSFKFLAKQAGALMRVRNKIAHGGRNQVMHIYADPQPTSEMAAPGYHSVVAASQFKTSDGADLDFKALRDHQKAVRNLATELRAYRTVISEALVE